MRHDAKAATRDDRAATFALPALVYLVTAGEAWRMGRDKTCKRARAGKFPSEVISAGSKRQVTKTALLRSLGLTMPGNPAVDGPPCTDLHAVS